MSNGAFLIDNIAADATPACSYEDTDYPASNLIDGIPSTKYRSTGTTAQPRWDFGSARKMTGFALIGHNIPDDAVSLKLQFSADDWSSVAEEIELTWAAGNIFAVFEEVEYRYCGILVELSSGTYVEIGEAFWGTALPLTRNFNDQYVDIKRVHKSAEEIDGQWFQRVRGSSRGKLLQFNLLSAAERLELEGLLEQDAVVFIPDQAGSECWHGIVPQDELRSALRRGLSSATVQFWANTGGGD